MTQPPLASSRPRCSVVITAHCEADGIAACLRSLMAQQGFEPGGLEVVLVDDRSTDGTAETAATVGAPNLTILRIDAPPKSLLTARQAALDLGIREARGEVILTLDADGVAPDTWAASLAGPILSGQADVVAGGVDFEGVWPLAELQSVDAAAYLLACRALAALGFDAGLLFGSCAFRAELYRRIGGFPALGFQLTEDLAFARAARRAGARLAFAPGQIARVRACGTWAELVERGRRTSAGGPSALAIGLSAWGLLLPALIAAALAAPTGPAATGLAVAAALRYGAGVLSAAWAVAAAGRPGLALYAPFYEPLALATAFRIAWRLARGGDVVWGGLRYRR